VVFRLLILLRVAVSIENELRYCGPRPKGCEHPDLNPRGSRRIVVVAHHETHRQIKTALDYGMM